MKVTRFEEFTGWQKSKRLAALIYQLFKNNKDYGFRDQIQRAAVSIMNNIAEGFERASNRELAYFLYIAKGSAGEVRSMLYVASENKYITTEQFRALSALTIEVSRLLSAFIKKIA